MRGRQDIRRWRSRDRHRARPGAQFDRRPAIASTGLLPLQVPPPRSRPLVGAERMMGMLDEVPRGLRDVPSVSDALTSLRNGTPVVVGALPWAFVMINGRSALAANAAALIRHGSGLLHVALEARRIRALGIPPMPVDSGSRCPHAHVAVDASAGITTGISAADRAKPFGGLVIQPAGRKTSLAGPRPACGRRVDPVVGAS